MIEKIEKPHLVTKPIQLLAAWLVGLSVIDASFLSAAKLMGVGTWECAFLVGASIANVPIFIIALFLLQTRFRPEMQEDAYYSEYIDKKTGNMVSLNKIDVLERRIEEIKDLLAKRLVKRTAPAALKWAQCLIAINNFLPFYDAMRARLREEEIPITSIFGNTGKNSEAPKHFIISFDCNMSSTLSLDLVKVCAEFPFDGFKMAEMVPDAEPEDVYIGSYETLDDYVPFSQEVKMEIAKATEAADFELLVRRFVVK